MSTNIDTQLADGAFEPDPRQFGGGKLKFRAAPSTQGVALPVRSRDLSEFDQRVWFYRQCRAEGIHFTNRRRGPSNVKKIRRIVKLERATSAQRLALTSRQRARAARRRLGRLLAERADCVDRIAVVNAKLARLVALNCDA